MILKEEKGRAGAALDDELTALLRMWDLEDAAEALAEHGWKSLSRLKRFKNGKHMHELGLPSGTVCALEAMLQSISCDTALTDSSGKTFDVEVKPTDALDAHSRIQNKLSEKTQHKVKPMSSRRERVCLLKLIKGKFISWVKSLMKKITNRCSPSSRRLTAP